MNMGMAYGEWQETTETVDISWLYPNATSNFTVGKDFNTESKP